MTRWRVGRADRGGGLRRAGGELGVQRGRPALGELRAAALARIAGSTGGRRSSSASAARRYRPVPPTTIGRRPAASSAVDLGVGARGERARAGGLGDRQHADQAVLEPRPLGGARRAGEDLQPAVELQRVGGHGDRVLPRGAQALGERDRHRRLADAGRPEDRDHGGTARSIVGGRCPSASAPGSPPSPDAARGRARGGRGRADRRSAASACDLAIVFASGAHLAAPEATLEAVHEALAPGAADRLRRRRRDRRRPGGRERHRASPSGPRTSARTASPRVPRRRRGARGGRGRADRHARPRRAPPARSCSPTRPPSRPTRCCASCRTARRCCRCSAASPPAARPTAARRCSSATRCVEEGAVGVRLDGVEVLPCVSQGAAPLGPELTITAAEGNVIDELAGMPALEKLRETIESAARRRPRAGPGRAADGDRGRRQQARLRAGRLPRARRWSAPTPRTGQGGGRAPTSTPARSCGCTRATPPAPTATCATRSASGWRRSAGAPRRARCVFACNGRGRGDVRAPPTTTPTAVAEELGGAPAAGFFAAGEIGPVGGEHFLHSFTATVAVFA